MSDLTAYHDHIKAYRTAVAKEDWPGAYAAIESAFKTCPVDEAFPTLIQLRNQAYKNAHPWSWLWDKAARVLGVAR